MSTNCVRCVVNPREGVGDLMCAPCREKTALERAQKTERDDRRLDLLDQITIGAVGATFSESDGKLRLTVTNAETGKFIFDDVHDDARAAIDALDAFMVQRRQQILAGLPKGNAS
jgi:hypothetical protein